MYKFIRLFNTVKYLKFIQIFYRLFYYCRYQARQLRGFVYCLTCDKKSTKLSFCSSIPSVDSYNKGTFTFLNISHKFEGEIDWNYSDFGKLWTYNLNYFEYLNQKELLQDKGLNLMLDYIEQISTTENGLEPYPISLRGINWIKFVTKYWIKNQKIDDSLYAQYQILIDNLEYHLLGNHLLENTFSLLFGAYYFQDEELYKKAKKILESELEEQILEDGAHFELSPMYHQIMLFRVLDCINLVHNNNWKNQELLELLSSKAEIMLGWLNTITYENGDMPLLNDSTNKIAPTIKQLNQYALNLNLKLKFDQRKSSGEKNLKLSDSGYRKIKNERYEMIVDVGNIGPDYIPGHAHSDTFNFELYIDEKPFIVDTGLSTYETNERRNLERSTASHNTVEIDGMDQSEVWSSFRVANRAYIVDIEETDDSIKAVHNGYEKRLGALHQREFLFEDKKIKIIDTVISEKEYNAIARLHFYPEIEPKIIEGGAQIDDIKIRIKSSNFKINDYNYAPEFNKLKKAKMLEIPFTKKLEIEIVL